MLIATPLLTFAEVYDVQGEVIPKEVRDADIERQINEILNEKRQQDNGNIMPMSGDHIYTSEIVATKFVTVGGYAGGQPTRGDQFPSGGGFIYNPSGGPEASGNVEFSIPYKWLSVSMNLGTAGKATVGNLYYVPSKTDYFKLYVECTIQVNQVNIYKQINVNNPKVLESVNYIQSLYSRSAWPIAQ